MAFQKTFYKKTEDDWFPSYEIEYQGILKLVGISCSQRPDGKIVILVYGSDDFGMIFEPENLDEAEQMINKIIGVKFVNIVWLEDLGFKTH